MHTLLDGSHFYNVCTHVSYKNMNSMYHLLFEDSPQFLVFGTPFFHCLIQQKIVSLLKNKQDQPMGKMHIGKTCLKQVKALAHLLTFKTAAST